MYSEKVKQRSHGKLQCYFSTHSRKKGKKKSFPSANKICSERKFSLNLSFIEKVEMISIVSQMMANYFYFVSVLKNAERGSHYTRSS